MYVLRNKTFPLYNIFHELHGGAGATGEHVIRIRAPFQPGELQGMEFEGVSDSDDDAEGEVSECAWRDIGERTLTHLGR